MPLCVFEGAGNPTAYRTKRQQEVLERLDAGFAVKAIAHDIGVTRNAVYQVIERLKRDGALPVDFTPSGQPSRRPPGLTGGVALPAAGAAGPQGGGRSTRIGSLRGLEEGASSEGGVRSAYAGLLAEAIAQGDALALAYELGRADAGGRSELSAGMVEAALRGLVELDAEASES